MRKALRQKRWLVREDGGGALPRQLVACIGRPDGDVGVSDAVAALRRVAELAAAGEAEVLAWGLAECTEAQRGTFADAVEAARVPLEKVSCQAEPRAARASPRHVAPAAAGHGQSLAPSFPAGPRASLLLYCVAHTADPS